MLWCIEKHLSKGIAQGNLISRGKKRVIKSETTPFRCCHRPDHFTCERMNRWKKSSNVNGAVVAKFQPESPQCIVKIFLREKICVWHCASRFNHPIQQGAGRGLRDCRPVEQERWFIRSSKRKRESRLPRPTSPHNPGKQHLFPLALEGIPEHPSNPCARIFLSSSESIGIADRWSCMSNVPAVCTLCYATVPYSPLMNNVKL